MEGGRNVVPATNSACSSSSICNVGDKRKVPDRKPTPEASFKIEEMLGLDGNREVKRA